MQEINFEFDIDEAELSLRNTSNVVLDDTWKLMARESRIGLSILSNSQWKHEDRKVLYLTLRCLAAPHPDCWLKWFKLTFKFEGPDGLRVEDMKPEEVKSSEPIKLTTTYKGGLSLEVSKVKLGPDAGIERQKETQYYFSEIRSSGKHFNYAQWIFDTLPGKDLHINRDLHLLVSYPLAAEEVISDISLRFHLARKGILGYLPLVGRKKELIEVNRKF